jgi:hypothetical protein
MRPILFLLVLCSLPSSAQDAKLPDDERSLEFYPSAKGTRLEYRLTLDGKAADFAAQVAGVETKDGKNYIKTSIQFGQAKLSEEYMVDQTGLYLLSGFAGKCEPPRTVLKYPLKAGDSWKEKFKEGGVNTESTATVRKPEMLELQAGKFKAFPVDTVIKQGEAIATATTWYAQGTGIVKMHVTNAPTPATITLELLKVTPAK